MNRTLATVGILIAVIVLTVVGGRLSPPQVTDGGSGNQGCKVEAPAAVQAAAQKWCDIGIFTRISVTGDVKNVIAVAQVSADAAQTWQIQGASLVIRFGALTDQLAAVSPGKAVSVAVHDPAERRLAACARAVADASATCSSQQ